MQKTVAVSAVSSASRASSRLVQQSDEGKPTTLGTLETAHGASAHERSACSECCSMSMTSRSHPSAASVRATATAPGGPSVSTGGVRSSMHGKPVSMAMPAGAASSSAAAAPSSWFLAKSRARLRCPSSRCTTACIRSTARAAHGEKRSGIATKRRRDFWTEREESARAAKRFGSVF